MYPPFVHSTDHAVVKRYVMLPLILTAFERDKGIIEGSGAFKTPGPYVAMIEAAMRRVGADIRDVKRELRERGIKVHTIDKTDTRIESKFVCRGYTGKFSLLDAYMAAEGGELMRAYLRGENVERPPE
ncbi:hypothetical protein [Paenibacillus campinasensis]|uniref:Uncharacterized protein n=1 Tax=Paenibacillus campinasensis TaxID=66347 RepID=A0A268EGZ1_9BACL|nr:hypothetical protein [Paenibacillus campinasensis]PAD72386.1 hypothetical protein CHH67_22350 [Paenibacillus campinasensis]